jgi:hypothetical protein
MQSQVSHFPSELCGGGLFHPGPAIYHDKVMRFVNLATRFVFVAAIAAVFSLATQISTQAQSTSTAPPATTPPPASTVPQPLSQGNGTYISTDPLAGVRYDNRWDFTVGLASGHIHAGPNLREGADLGGLDLSGSYWLSKHWAVEGSARGYLGTSGTAPNPYSLDGLFVAQYMFLAGPEYLWLHNKHADIMLHGLVGGAYGDFNSDLRGHTPGPTGPAGFYTNQTTIGGAFGGHIDLNRSPRWVFRITPDALLTGYDGTSLYPHTQWNFGISAGVEYKFKKKR